MNKTQILAAALICCGAASTSFAQSTCANSTTPGARCDQTTQAAPSNDTAHTNRAPAKAEKKSAQDWTATNGGLTRAQVKADLAKARRDGAIPEGDSGETDAHRYPDRYKAQRVKDGLPAKAQF